MITVVLFGGATGAWLAHQNSARLREAEAKYRDATRDARQALVDQQGQMTARAAAFAEREHALLSDLNASRLRVGQLTAELLEKSRAIADLTGQLDRTAADLGSLRTDHASLARSLASAKASIAILGWKASLADATRQLARQFAPSLAPPTQSAYRVDALPVHHSATHPRARRLPPSLDHEDVAVSLRQIVED